MATTPDQAGGYDLASGFGTLISTQQAMLAAIRDVQTAVVAGNDMAQRYGSGGGGATAGRRSGGAAGGSGGSGPGTGGSGPGSGAGGGQAPPGNPLAGMPAGGAGSTTIGTKGITDWARKVIPGVGVGLDVFDEMKSQVNKDNYYRNIEGGGHGNAIAERLNEESYKYSSMRLYSDAEARQAFKGASRIGYTRQSDQLLGGTSRAQALDFVYSGKSERGQDVNEGLQQLQAASKSLTVSLGGLNVALNDVSKSAASAGVNTQMARQQFMGLFSQGVGRGQGSGAAGFAQAISGTTASYGRAYATGVDQSGLYSNTTLYRAASMSGMSAGSLVNLQRKDPAAAAQAFGKLQMSSLASAGVTPDMIAWIKQKINERGGAAAIKAQPDYATQIANDFLDQYGAGLDPNAFPAILGQLSGQNFNGNIELAAQFVVETVANNTVASTAAATQGMTQTTDLNGIMANGQKNTALKGSLNDVVKGSRVTHALRGDEQSQAAQAYASAAQSSGRRDPVIEALLQNKNLQGNKGNDQMVQVMAKGGNYVMSLADAVKHFPNEIAAGKITFVGGSNAGKSVSGLGISTDTKRDYGAESNQDASKWGTKASAYGQAGSGQVLGTIGLTPEAAKLVTVLGPQGSITQGALTGTTPTSPWADSGSR